LPEEGLDSKCKSWAERSFGSGQFSVLTDEASSDTDSTVESILSMASIGSVKRQLSCSSSDTSDNQWRTSSKERKKAKAREAKRFK